MLKRLSLENFKLHAATTIEAAPVTVFIGPNNSGKSSLFQALLLLRQASGVGRPNLCALVERQATSPEQPYLFPTNEAIVLGAFEDVIRQGEGTIRLNVEGTVFCTQPARYRGPIDLGFKVHIRSNRLVYHSGHVKCAKGELRWDKPVLASGHGPEPPLEVEVDGFRMQFRCLEDFRLIGYAGVQAPSSFPPDEFSQIQEFGMSLGNSPNLLLRSLHPIFPLRGFEEWAYPLPSTTAPNVEQLALADRAIAMTSMLAYNRNLEGELSGWLEHLLQTRIEVELRPGRRVTIWARPAGKTSPHTLFLNEGTGANQLPFIFVPIGLTPPEESIFLSEPEAHLHPKAQSALVGLLLKISKEEKRQFLIETHSEHILHSLLHAVARGELTRSDLAVYYFEAVEGKAQVRRLEVDEKGRVDGGLPGFFEHSLAELSDYLDALKKT